MQGFENFATELDSNIPSANVSMAPSYVGTGRT
jgi:hypothetical protein